MALKREPRLEPPPGTHVTYQLQYRKCGKPSCLVCHRGEKHGPYWYAYWRENGRLRSGYIGKNKPGEGVKERESGSLDN